MNKQTFGVGDASYQAAGGIDGIQKLVGCFYDLMDSLPESQNIRAMHRKDLKTARTRLAWFLSGWLGGPKLYQEQVGSISIPGFHRRCSTFRHHAPRLAFKHRSRILEQSRLERRPVRRQTCVCVAVGVPLARIAGSSTGRANSGCGLWHRSIDGSIGSPGCGGHRN